MARPGHDPEMSEPPLRRRSGCLGCLPGLAMLLVVVTVGLLVGDAIFFPWIHTVGGKVRLLPLWQGVADVDGPGGRYRLYVWFSPTSEKQHVLPATAVEGGGYVCTPRGQRYDLRISGGARGQVWRTMDGHEFHLFLEHRPLNAQFVESSLQRPRLTLRGRWDGPNLAMNDTGSFRNGFHGDGTLIPRAPYAHPETPALPVALTETAWWPNAACPGPGPEPPGA